MEKLLMCRICLVENVRLCVVTDESLQEMYEKLADVPFVTEDRKPMLACFYCCTRLKQCCQLQRKCVEAEKVLAQMLIEDYEQKPLTNNGHFEFVGGFIITPVENISIGADCQIGSDAIKQELPAVCEEQEEVNLENVYNSHSDVKANHSSKFHEYQCGIEIKIEVTEEDVEMDKRKLENADPSHPDVIDIPAQGTESELEYHLPLLEIRGRKRKRRACEIQRAAVDVAKKPTLNRKLEDTIPAKQTMNVLSDSTTETSSTSESVDQIKEPITATFQRSFIQSSNLIQHTRKKPYKCDVCERSFRCKTKLIVHLRKHSGEKPFKCDVCLRSFTQSAHLKQHIRAHTGEKPFKCDVCRQSFSRKSSLKIHTRLHTGEKPYKCDVCQRSFNQSNILIIHRRLHTGEKPYKCDVCQSRFICKYKLNIHLKSHSGEKPYKCDVCQQSYTAKKNLELHLRKHPSN